MTCRFGCPEIEDQIHTFTKCSKISVGIEIYPKTPYSSIFGTVSEQKRVMSYLGEEAARTIASLIHYYWTMQPISVIYCNNICRGCNNKNYWFLIPKIPRFTHNFYFDFIMLKVPSLTFYCTRVWQPWITEANQLIAWQKLTILPH